MKKFYAEALVVSVFIGIFIRVLALLLTGQSLLTSIEDYFFSAVIAMISCTLTFGVHVKVLTNNQYSFITKHMISSMVIIAIYVIGNLYAGGTDVIFQWEFYGYAIAVVLVSLPLIHYFNKRIMRFNEFLHLKKSRHASE
ncbi:hypothetical protein [Paenibacillus aquistagni]|uniref:Uncharacterized protein n=1 Tax=Paenibacillus aquistagni TaxID=1852522 RepID=A0A1X7J5A6_9BACL|nr:hypothetical protein [Paenibacillus aquistagni]SMG22865.1 hypothetical protein SAMN06295960_1236 [Paenibacillus aquistagni]